MASERSKGVAPAATIAASRTFWRPQGDAAPTPGGLPDRNCHVPVHRRRIGLSQSYRGAPAKLERGTALGPAPWVAQPSRVSSRAVANRIAPRFRRRSIRAQEVGWPTGVEPVTFGATIRCECALFVLGTGPPEGQLTADLTADGRGCREPSRPLVLSKQDGRVTPNDARRNGGSSRPAIISRVSPAPLPDSAALVACRRWTSRSRTRDERPFGGSRVGRARQLPAHRRLGPRPRQATDRASRARCSRSLVRSPRGRPGST